MNDHEIRRKLEGEYRGKRRISDAEWEFLIDDELWESFPRFELEHDKNQWAEFADIVRRKLDNLAAYVRRIDGQQLVSTERKPVPAISSDSGSVGLDPYSVSMEMDPAREKLLARAEALHLYDKAKAKKDDIPFKPLLNAAGFLSGWSHGTPPDWIGVMSTPLWVPAEEVKKIYERLQKAFLKDVRPRKTQERTYKVVRFVWEREQRLGKRPPWRQLTEEWNTEVSEEDKVPDWRAFRKNFRDGEASTLPKLVHEEYRLQEMLKDGRQLAAFDIWASATKRML